MRDWNPPLDGRRRTLDRRSALKLGVTGVLGMSLPHCLALAEQRSHRAKAKNVLVILEQGGLSHIDTWDPKPLLVSDHRSPYRPISTRIPGMQFTELLSKTALHADKLAVVRSFRHARGGADAHPNGTQYVLSGVHPAANPLEMPDMGCIASRILGSDCRYLPPYVMVPGNNEQAAETRTGFLPASLRVFKTGGRDVSSPNWRIDALQARTENQGDRFGHRQRLVDFVDRPLANGSASANPRGDGMDRFYEQAYDMLSNPQVSAAFDVQREPEAVRSKYGSGHRGACYLVGRKLIEAGVRFVTVDVRWPAMPGMPGGGNLNWDHHDHIYATGTCELPGATGAGAGRYGIGHWFMMGSVDHAFAALLDDLQVRGLLDETLVCFVTEFGRTPRINPAKGRDHWTRGYSMVFAGAGVRGGQVIGRTDREGGDAIDQVHTPEDYASTVYEKLGIDRGQPLYTSSNRPVYFGHLGEPIPELL